MLDEARELGGVAPDFPNIASIAVGAVFARVYEEVAIGNIVNLPKLMPQLMFELLLHYIGEEAAGMERDVAATELAGEGDAKQLSGGRRRYPTGASAYEGMKSALCMPSTTSSVRSRGPEPRADRAALDEGIEPIRRRTANQAL